MELKCKICGGGLIVPPGQLVGVCEYCGVKQTIPRFTDESVRLTYERANNYFAHNEFDKAEHLYVQILTTNPEDADIYWNIAMCRYGITYVKSPSDGKYVPTCNRTLTTSIFNDEFYNKAIQFANEEQKALYNDNAKTIDDIQKGILKISHKEKPFDIFISYKETDANGIRTVDSIKAQELYDKLTEEGYKVFFSRITLEDKAGEEYEPYIYSALESSKVMIILGSSKDNLEATWVKNEWSRFIGLTKKDNTKIIVPVFFDMDKSGLPDEFLMFPIYDLNANGFEQELLYEIKKIIPEPIAQKEKRIKTRKILQRMSIILTVLLILMVTTSIPIMKKNISYNQAIDLLSEGQYQQSIKIFDELAGFRKSRKLKDQAEQKWRHMVANVYLDCTYSNLSVGTYYITQNGNVESISSKTGGANSNVNINEHGQVVSIADGDNIYALHEDGYVENTKDISTSNENWSDIIQISNKLLTTPIALTSEGKIIFGKTDEQDEKANFNITDEWLKKTESWENIKYFVSYVSPTSPYHAFIIGIRYDGDFYVTYYDGMDIYSISEDMDLIMNKFSDVKSMKLSDRYSTDLIALTNHGTIQTMIENEFNEIDAKDVVDCAISRNSKPIYNNAKRRDLYSVYLLKEDGKLYEYGSNNYILEDIVYINSNIAISRNGTIYKNYGNNVTKENGKCTVYDEWIGRLK